MAAGVPQVAAEEHHRAVQQGLPAFRGPLQFGQEVAERLRQRFNPESAQRNFYAGLFLQDEWRVRPNLTVACGLRYENETVIRDRNNLGPRLALAFDPFKSGKTVLRLGAGVFYNRALLQTRSGITSQSAFRVTT